MSPQLQVKIGRRDLAFMSIDAEVAGATTAMLDPEEQSIVKFHEVEIVDGCELANQ